MNKTMVLLFTILCVIFMCSCDNSKLEERHTYYEVIERNDAEEIKAAAKEVEAKSRQLLTLAQSYIYTWNDYKSGNKTLDEMQEARKPLIDFFVSEGFAESYFSGADDETDRMIEQFRSELYDEYLAVMSKAKEIMKQEAIGKLGG